MKSQLETFLEALGGAVIAQDFTAAHGMLAEWLRNSMSVEDLTAQIEERLQDMADEWGFDEMRFPQQSEVGEGDMSLDELRTEIPGIRPEVTDDNFRQWASLQFQPGEKEDVELDAYFDWWVLLVEVEGRIQVGHFEFEDPD